jgi:hypothetical protein
VHRLERDCPQDEQVERALKNVSLIAQGGRLPERLYGVPSSLL